MLISQRCIALLRLCIGFLFLPYHITLAGYVQDKRITNNTMVIHFRNLGLLLFFGLLLLQPYLITFSGDMQGKRRTSTRQPSFDPFGIYAIIGGKSNAFGNFYSFQVDLLKKPVKGRPLDIAGHVQFSKDGSMDALVFANFSDIKLSLTDATISFATEEAEGISFVFEGQFLRKDNFSKLRRGTPVLEGILIKNVDGKEFAKKNIQFSYVNPD
jgi:hypothetical protein